MRILMTADAIGGVWTYALELARAFGERAEIVLATMGDPLTPAQWEEVSALDNVRVCQSQYQLEWMNDPWDDVARAGDWLLELEQTYAPDVVHLNGYVHAALPWQAPALVVGHSCVFSWWDAVKGERAPARYARYHEAVRRGLQAAALVVTPSAAMLRALERHYGILNNTRVIPNARSARFYRTADKQPVVLAAGRLWDEAKNIVTLASAAPQLDWEVVIAGDDHHPDGHRVDFDNVRALGRLSARELAGWMSHAPIFALPARYEPFGLSPLEAALSGCALVLGDIPSLREVWGDTALFVPPSDAEALAQAVNRLIHNPPLCLTLSARAQVKARAYSPQRMAAAYSEVYRQLIAAGQPTCEYDFSTTR